MRPTVLCLLFIFVLSGCGGTGPPKREAYVYVVDYSASTAASRHEQLGAMLAELDEVPEGTDVAIYRMGSTTQEIYNGSVGDEGLDPIILTVKQKLSTSDPVRGTNFAAMARALVAFAKGYPGASLKIRIFTDGGDDFRGNMQNQAAYYAAARIISTEKRLNSLVFCGVEPEFTNQVREAFGEAGPKLQIISANQLIGG